VTQRPWFRERQAWRLIGACALLQWLLLPPLALRLARAAVTRPAPRMLWTMR
jgi:hypothetical protein